MLGNVKKMDALPAGSQAGDNHNAFRSGLWEEPSSQNFFCQKQSFLHLPEESHRETDNENKSRRVQ